MILFINFIQHITLYMIFQVIAPKIVKFVYFNLKPAAHPIRQAMA